VWEKVSWQHLSSFCMRNCFLSKCFSFQLQIIINYGGITAEKRGKMIEILDDGSITFARKTFVRMTFARRIFARKTFALTTFSRMRENIFHTNVFWANVSPGKCFPGKCHPDKFISGQMSSGQMSSGQMSYGLMYLRTNVTESNKILMKRNVEKYF
jgi:hypothetical protein